jgi:hypothetical protein
MSVKITLSPTEEFFRTNDEILVRAWTGTNEAGEHVDALVAAVRSSGFEMPGLVPIPPPNPTWSPAVQEAMDRLWLIAGILVDEEAIGVVRMAEFLASSTLTVEQRKFAGQKFIDGMQMLIGVWHAGAH